MILVDSNILMYSAGADHPNKALAVAFLEKVSCGEVNATIDAAVLREIIHRYRALSRWADGRAVYVLAREIFPNVLAVTGKVMDRALELVDADAGLSARDAVHAAVVQVYGLEEFALSTWTSIAFPAVIAWSPRRGCDWGARQHFPAAWEKGTFLLWRDTALKGIVRRAVS